MTEQSEKNKEYQRRYREKNKEKRAAANKEWREKNKEANLEQRRRYREENRDRIREQNRGAYGFTYKTRPEIWILSNIKKKCKDKKIPFDITAEDIVAPEFCPVLGLKLERNHEGSRSGPKANSPTVDRIIPERGYVKGNVIVISHLANAIKQNAAPYQIRLVADFYEKLMGSLAVEELRGLQ